VPKRRQLQLFLSSIAQQLLSHRLVSVLVPLSALELPEPLLLCVQQRLALRLRPFVLQLALQLQFFVSLLS